MSKYTIEARSLKIPYQSYLPQIASHNFYVLKDENNKIISEIHGMATDRKTGKILPIGDDEKLHSLRVHEIKDQKYFYSNNNQKSYTVYSGDKEEVLARWNTAVKAIHI